MSKREPEGDILPLCTKGQLDLGFLERDLNWQTLRTAGQKVLGHCLQGPVLKMGHVENLRLAGCRVCTGKTQMVLTCPSDEPEWDLFVLVASGQLVYQEQDLAFQGKAKALALQPGSSKTLRVQPCEPGGLVYLFFYDRTQPSLGEPLDYLARRVARAIVACPGD